MVFEDDVAASREELSSRISVAEEVRHELHAALFGEFDFVVLLSDGLPTVSHTQVGDRFVHQLPDMEPVGYDLRLGEYAPRDKHHRGRKVDGDLLYLAAKPIREFAQDADHLLALGPCDHRHQSPLSAVGRLVGEHRVELSLREAGLVQRESLAEILRIEYIRIGVQPLTPRFKAGDEMTVLSGQLPAVDAVKAGDGADAQCTVIYAVLLKKPRTHA